MRDMSRHPPSAAYWTRSGSLVGFAELARSLGQDAQPMLRRFKLPAGVLDDPELRISYTSLCGLLEACAEDWHCDDFGLRRGQVQHLDLLGPIGLVARLSERVGDALQALCAHLNIHSTGFEVQLLTLDEATPPRVDATYTPRAGTGAGRQILELSMGAMRNIVAMVCGNPAFRPLQVRLACVAPADKLPARRLFGCPVHYGEEQSVLCFDARLMAQPTAIRDDAIAPLVRSYLEQFAHREGSDFVEATRKLIGDLLTTGRCSQRVVADCLNLHPRSFQRRLEALGTSFSRLLDEHRHALALDLVTRRRMPLARVAGVLGYADQSVFNQAFRRWTGSTPTQLQAVRSR
jgi:AraC-like DNA-binding protein